MVGVRQVLRSSSKISAVNLLGGAVAFLANFVIARRVGPEVLGAVGLINLWLLYAGLIRPGLVSAAQREMLHLGGAGKPEEALHVQNVAFTYEGSLLVATVLVLVLGGRVYDEPFLRLGLVLGAAAFVARSLSRFQETIQWVGHRFELIARANLITRLLTPLLSVAGAYRWGGYGLLAAPIIPALVTVYFYRRAAPPSGFKPAWDGPRAAALARVGIPLTLLTLLYWGFRTSDRTMVAAWLPLQSLGYFTFAMNIIDMGIQLSSDFYNVLQARLLTELGKVGKVRPMAPMLARLAVLTVALTGLGANLAQAGFQPLVERFLPKFLPSVVPFEILVFNLACLSAPMLPATLLMSTLLARQNACVVVQLLGLGLNVALGAAFTSHGWGLEGIAVSSVVSQLFVTASYYRLLHGPLFEGAAWPEKARLYGWQAALTALCLGVYLLMAAGGGALRAEGPRWLAPLAARLALVCSVWGLVLAQVHRSWWAESTAVQELWDAVRAKAGFEPSDAP